MFIWMLHMFHTYVACVLFRCVYVCNGFQVFSGVLFQVFQKHVLSVSFVFRRMLQLLYLDVSKVDQVLHLFSSPSAISRRCVLFPAPVGHPYDATTGSFRIRGVVPFPSCCSGDAGLAWSAENRVQHVSVCPDVRTLAKPFQKWIKR
jgi:hypothetical protein